jgi:hypothetical protein
MFEYKYLHTSGTGNRSDEPPEGLRSVGASALANAIKDIGAISSVNLLKNNICVEQAQELVKIMQSKEKLTTLCGFSGNEAMLDFSIVELNPGDAVLIANDISDMGALSVLSLKGNKLATKESGKALAQALASNSTLKELDVSSNNWQSLFQWKGDGPGFAQELAVGIKDNGALSCPTGDNRFEAKKRLFKATSTCKHCGQHKDDHSRKVQSRLSSLHS